MPGFATGEVWIEGMHIPPYEQGDDKRGYEPTRPRKLLLHQREITRLGATQKGLSLGVLRAMRVYFAHGLAKMELGLGRGRRQFEKRQVLAEREHKREMERESGRRR